VDVSQKLITILGKKGWVGPDDSVPWQRDWLDKYGEIPLGVARPSSTKELQQVIRICYSNKVSVVPQGGNTGLVGAGVLDSPGGIIISLSRMDAISNLDISSSIIEVEAGVILENLHMQLRGTDFFFPMHLGSQGSAQIGGLIATNAGGSHAFRYGMMQDLVIGLEVVLADGTIWNGMRSVQKDNAGYQLRKIFCGSEGTLGIITKAVLKLAPFLKNNSTALLAIKDISSLMKLANRFRSECGEFLTAMEFFSDLGVDIAMKHIPDLVFPLNNRTPIYLLVEVGSCSDKVPLDELLSDVIEWGIDEDIIIDGSIAASEAQKLVFWRLREDQPEGQRRLGQQLKHDISVPPSMLNEFIKDAELECNQTLSGVIINYFGHLGDGNIHFNLSPPMGEKNFSNLDKEFGIKLARIATRMGGSFAAEHGIGRAKIELTDLIRDPIERDLMLQIKKAFDSKNSLNPGALISFK
tara:strand:- start:13926 stop:15326 length:1401 start_codon:yes stop_codon:yes gene_type:complete